MKSTCLEDVFIIASPFAIFSEKELSSIKGGTDVRTTHPSEGCGCCLCTPQVSASGAGSYTATASGGRVR